jgi:butyrate kinase
VVTHRWMPLARKQCLRYACAQHVSIGANVTAQKVGKQIRVVSYYSPESVDELKRLAEVTRVQQSVYLREALDDLLQKYAANLRKAAK